MACLIWIFPESLLYILWTPDDAKVFGEIYWEENDIILVPESRVGICLKNDLVRNFETEKMVFYRKEMFFYMFQKLLKKFLVNV